jgi:hypothetical protein
LPVKVGSKTAFSQSHRLSDLIIPYFAGNVKPVKDSTIEKAPNGGFYFCKIHIIVGGKKMRKLISE